MITYKGQSAEANIPTACKVTTPGKLDFRFADEEDAKEIVNCVAASFRLEFDSESPFYNRAKSWEEAPLITAEQVEKDCSSANLRWIVLETPLPEEIVVSTARLSMAGVMAGDSKIIVDILAYIEDTENMSVRDQMLVQLERVAKSQGVKTLVVEISQHREDLQSWVESCGYEELGGRISSDDNYVKSTMIFEYHKDLTKPSKVISRAPSTATEAVSVTEKLSDLNISSEEVVTCPPPEGGMAGLMSDLFAALHKEHPN